MAELVDAPDSKSGAREGVGVRFPLRHPGSAGRRCTAMRRTATSGRRAFRRCFAVVFTIAAGAAATRMTTCWCRAGSRRSGRAAGLERSARRGRPVRVPVEASRSPGGRLPEAAASFRRTGPPSPSCRRPHGARGEGRSRGQRHRRCERLVNERRDAGAAGRHQVQVVRLEPVGVLLRVGVPVDEGELRVGEHLLDQHVDLAGQLGQRRTASARRSGCTARRQVPDRLLDGGAEGGGEVVVAHLDDDGRSDVGQRGEEGEQGRGRGASKTQLVPARRRHTATCMSRSTPSSRMAMFWGTRQRR